MCFSLVASSSCYSLNLLNFICSPKLAACAFNLSYPYPESTLGLETVCHLLVSILACWPAYGWTPGLFHFLVDNLQTTSLLALGPKEICSLFCLLVGSFSTLITFSGLLSWNIFYLKNLHFVPE